MSCERYLVMLGRHRARRPESRPLVAGLRRKEISEQIEILTAPAVQVQSGSGWVIIGQVLGLDALAGRAHIRPDDLVGKCWGNYLAIGVSPSGDPVWLLRAPLGHLPVLLRRCGEQLRVGSHAEDLLDGTRPAIDSSFIANHLAFPHLKTAQTGICGIEELLGGECLYPETSGPLRKRMAWSPWDWTQAEREIAELPAASEMLRTAVLGAVSGLTPASSTSLLELSGGLDSSVLAASLAGTRRNARAATLVTDQAEGDERLHARAAASATGLELDELGVGLNDDLARPAPIRSPRPGLPAMLWPADHLLARRAQELGASAFISGAGGDCVFCSLSSAAPAVDTALRFGWGRELWKATDALARIHNENVWTVLHQVWRSRRRPIRSRWPVSRELLAADIVPARAPEHPWFKPPDDTLPGRRDHVFAILASLAHVDGYPRHRVAPTRFPLLSQPVVEAALRTPSWLWIVQGCDRAAVRIGWRGTLPDQILDRRTKGGLDSYALASLELCRGSLRDFLLGGHLAAMRMIDRETVEGVLASRARRGATAPHAVLPLIDTEAWLRSWLG